MANPSLSTGCYYHIYNRGVEKRKVFLDKRDYKRFLETINFYRKDPVPMKLLDFRRGVIKMKKLEDQTDLVRIFCYSLMPNHFHLLVQQLEENGLTIFLRKLSDSYTRYFNTKYERVGSLFQGSFKAKLIENEEYLLQLSKYIHANSFPLSMWEGKVYPYSSYQYYLTEGRHLFCETDLILSYFSKTNPDMGYKAFVESTSLDGIALGPLFIDSED